MGFGYPVKNRGIRLIRRYLFSGRFPYAASRERCLPIVGLEPEQTLWRFWRELRDEPDSNNRKTIKRFKKMQHGDMTVEDGYLYLKWQDHGIGVPVKLHTRCADGGGWAPSTSGYPQGQQDVKAPSGIKT